MSKFRIPKKFNLMGQTIRVEVVDDLMGDDGAYGRFLDNTNKIQIAGNIYSEKAQHTFCHELMHACLTALSHELNDDEQFVDQMGHLIHQAFSTTWGEHKFPEQEEDE